MNQTPLPQPLAGLPEKYQEAVLAYAAAAVAADTALLRQALDALTGYPYEDAHWRSQCVPAIAALRARLEGETK